MDDVLIGAVEVLSDTSDIKPFFAIVKDVYDENGSDFDEFKTALLADTNGYANERQALVEYADSNQQLDLIRQLSDLGPDQLLTDYEQYLDEAEQAEQADGEDAGEDEEDDGAGRQEFVEYLTQYSAYWDGTEENWDEFVNTIQDYALETYPRHAQEFFDRAAAATDKVALFAEYGITIGSGEESADEAEDDDAARQAFVNYLTEYSAYWDGTEENWDEFVNTVQDFALETYPRHAQDFFDQAAASTDKVALFAEYGITIASGEESAEGTPEDAEGEGLWAAAVEAYGPAWAEWDGSEEGWEQYRDWFYDATNNDNPESYAVAYEKLNPLNELGLAQRVAALRDFGFTVTVEAAEAAADEAALPTPEDIAQAAEVLVGAVDALPEADQQLVTPDLLKEVLETDPELASLSPEDLAQVMQEVGAARAEMQAG